MNFSRKAMGTRIHSSCVSSDGFEIENLLECEKLKTAGFQAERFSRTPIFVTLSFSTPIEIKFILLTPYIGRQCAGVVQIFTLHSTRPIDDSTPFQTNDVTFRAGTTQLHHPTTVCFRNRYHRSLCDFDDSPAINERHQVVDLQGKLHHVVAIKIGIMSMSVGSVPSIKSLEVWATPSKSCSREKRRDIVQRWRNSKKNEEESNIIKNHVGDKSKEAEKSVSTNEKNNCLGQSLPKEFFDPITCAIMKNPVLLPSGQTVDRVTLDKHISSQTEWGRPPSDPFTGIAFTDTYQPIPNVNLKMKLDEHFMRIAFLPPSGENSQQSSITKNENLCLSTQNCFSTNNHISPSTSGNTAIGRNFHYEKDEVKSRVLRIPHSSDNPLRCCKCRVLFSLQTTRYLLPCEHKLCRNCLLALSVLICPRCEKKFERKNVSRTFS